jgi:hypothetical protein
LSNIPYLDYPSREDAALSAEPVSYRNTGDTRALGARLSTLPVSAAVAAYIVLPILLSQVSDRLLTLTPHGVVNLEVLLIGAVGAFLPRWVVFLLLLTDFLAACVYSVCYTYQFLFPALMDSARFVGNLPVARLAGGAAVVLAAGVFSFMLAAARPEPRRRMHAAIALAIFGAVLISLDGWTGHNPFWHRDLLLMQTRVTSSPILTLAVREYSARRLSGEARGAGNGTEDSASVRLAAWLSGPDAGRDPSVVEVVVESWGLLLNPDLQKAMMTPYAADSITQRYSVKMGAVPFTGLTVPGEARELCGSAMGFGILHPASNIARQCLPEKFDALGYETIAIHGYQGEMFRRSTWYPELGFERTFFARDMDKLGLPHCAGAFPGICDGAIAGLIEDRLLDRSDTKPRFIYWVTLNSHIPVPARPDLPDDGTCAAQPALRTSMALCSWFRLVQAVQASMSRVAAGANERPTVFLLVGDHAPPFANPELRGQFSGSMVPYVMLTPKAVASR